MSGEDRRSTTAPTPPTRRELFRLFLREKSDPEPFYERLADKSIAEFPLPVDGRRILDLGSGPGHYTEALRRIGGEMHPIDLEFSSLSSEARRLDGAVCGDAMALPFPDDAFDGVFCSNMLEHTPSVDRVFDEIARVLRPGGWAWVSWTNWYSPWGGHNIVPLHYLGPRLGIRVWRRLFGEPPKNIPFEGLWPTYIGRTLRALRADERFAITDAYPRYYPSQRWILAVPGARELLTWNCLLLLERRNDT